MVDQVTSKWGVRGDILHLHSIYLSLPTSPPAYLRGAAPGPHWNSKHGILFADLAKQQGLLLTFSPYSNKGKGCI